MLKVVQQNFRHKIYAGDAVVVRHTVKEKVTHRRTEYIPGAPGASAYEIAVANGFVGTEAEWLESLQGENGTPGGGSVQSEFLTVTDPNITSHVLGNEPLANSLQVFLNGLREFDYTVTGDTVDFNLDLGAGDRLTFDYLLGE